MIICFHDRTLVVMKPLPLLMLVEGALPGKSSLYICGSFRQITPLKKL